MHNNIATLARALKVLIIKVFNFGQSDLTKGKKLMTCEIFFYSGYALRNEQKMYWADTVDTKVIFAQNQHHAAANYIHDIQ